MKNLKKFLRLFRNKIFLKVSAVILLIIIAALGTFYYFTKEGRIFIDDSVISAPVINISSLTPGVLNEIDVTENQNVRNGDLLAVVGSQTIRAQTDGIIISANKQIGSIITPQSSVVQLINPGDFRVVGTIDENKGLKDIRVGQVASFTIDAYPGQTFWGYVDTISPTAKQTQLSFSISNERPTQQFNILVGFDFNKYPQIKNGMSAKLVIYTKTN